MRIKSFLFDALGVKPDEPAWLCTECETIHMSEVSACKRCGSDRIMSIGYERARTLIFNLRYERFQQTVQEVNHAA